MYIIYILYIHIIYICIHDRLNITRLLKSKWRTLYYIVDGVYDSDSFTRQ